MITARISLNLYPSLSIRRSYPSLPAGVPNYILCTYRAHVNKVLLFSHLWHVHVSSSSCWAASTDFAGPLPQPSLSSIAPGRSSRLHPVSTYSCSIKVLAGRPNFARPCKGVHRGISVSPMSGWSNLDSFRDGWSVAVKLLLCGVLPPGLVQYCSLHLFIIAVN